MNGVDSDNSVVMIDSLYQDVRISIPEYSDWQCRIVPGMVVRSHKGSPVPNRFQRLMQRVVFGFRWERVK